MSIARCAQRAAAALAAIVLLLVWGASGAAEQSPPPQAVDFGALAKESAEAGAARRAASGGQSQPTAAADLLARSDALLLRENEWNAGFRQRSFEWHLLSTKIIFGLVVAIVVFGLFLTYLQFRKDYTDPAYVRPPAAPPEGGDPAAGSAAPSPPRPVTTMKLGPGGLELSSQLIGLAVLAFSLGFFYLYVKEVYPMHETNLAPPATTTTPAR